MGNGYPDGIGVEAFTFKALEEVWKTETDSEKREHVALNFYDYVNDKIPSESSFTVGTISCPKKYARPDIVLDVNTEMDYQMMKKLYEYIIPMNPNFTFTNVIEWYENNYNKGMKNGN